MHQADDEDKHQSEELDESEDEDSADQSIEGQWNLYSYSAVKD